MFFQEFSEFFHAFCFDAMAAFVRYHRIRHYHPEADFQHKKMFLDPLWLLNFWEELICSYLVIRY